MQLLDLMTEDDWQRVGTHTESGRYTTEDWLTIYARTRTITPHRSVDCARHC